MYFQEYFKTTTYFSGMSTISANLKLLRKRRGLSQSELATIVGTSQQVIALYEKGSQRPSAKRLPKLAQALNVTVDEIIGTQEIEPQPKTTRKHKNTRAIKMQHYFDMLTPEEQRITLKQIKALIDSKNKKSNQL